MRLSRSRRYLARSASGSKSRSGNRLCNLSRSLVMCRVPGSDQVSAKDYPRMMPFSIGTAAPARACPLTPGFVQVPKGLIREVIEMAIRAPSSLNTQPWHFYVVTGARYRRLGRRHGHGPGACTGCAPATGPV
ncbi:MAG: nitroreductase family protein [Pseudomonadales bacterium]